MEGSVCETVVVPRAAEATAYVGGSPFGRTQALADGVVALLAHGGSAGDVVVYVATPWAVAETRRQLAARLGDKAADIDVLTPREQALRILDAGRARELTGRKPRLMAPFERNALLEDTKTTGIKPGRLRKMLDFFSRAWATCEDFSDGWLVNDEERGVHDTVKGHLAMTGGVLDAEVSNLALRYLLSVEGAATPFAHRHVLVDDYQSLCRASQLLVNALADESLAVAVDISATSPVFERYPYAGGMDELLAMHPGLHVVHMVPAMGPAPEVCAFDGPHEELGGIVDLVNACLADGVPAREICVVAPNKVWRAAVARGLEDGGVACTTVEDARALSGDVRDMTRCEVARAYTLLALVADSEDAVAWRSWCGFGDALLRNTAFAALRAYCEEHGEGMLDVLRELVAVCDGQGGGELGGLVDVLGMADVIDAFYRGSILVERLSGLTGPALLDAVGRAVALDEPVGGQDAALGELAGFVGYDEDAASIMARINRHVMLPRYGMGGNQYVCVALPAETVGLTFSALIMCGMLDGMIPARACLDASVSSNDRREKLMDDARRMFAATRGRACQRLVLTYFKECDANLAGMLDLVIDRIHIRKGERMCKTRQSCLLKG